MKKTGKIAARKGGNGGYSKKAKPQTTHGPKRTFNLRDYSGKKVKR